MEALDGKGTPKFLQKVFASYFTDRILRYDTETGPKQYSFTEEVRIRSRVPHVEYHARRFTEVADPKSNKTGSVCR